MLDTFSGYCGQPHVVADEGRVICDFSGSSSGNQVKTEARTFYCGPDTWGPTVPVTDLDTLYSSYLNGGKLAIDPSGAVHACLMVCDLAQWEYNTYYAVSTDHGVTWAQREMVNDVTTGTQADPNIAADSGGYAYVIWQDQRNGRDEIWSATNNLLAVEESPVPQAVSPILSIEPTVFRNSVRIRLDPSNPRVPDSCPVRICDASGRLVRSLAVPSSATPHTMVLDWDGRDSYGRRCAPGAYLVRAGTAVAKVVFLPSE